MHASHLLQVAGLCILEEVRGGLMLLFNFILGLSFISLVFGGMIMYDSEFKAKENKI